MACRWIRGSAATALQGSRLVERLSAMQCDQASPVVQSFYMSHAASRLEGKHSRSSSGPDGGRGDGDAPHVPVRCVGSR